MSRKIGCLIGGSLGVGLGALIVELVPNVGEIVNPELFKSYNSDFGVCVPLIILGFGLVGYSLGKHMDNYNL